MQAFPDNKPLDIGASPRPTGYRQIFTCAFLVLLLALLPALTGCTTESGDDGSDEGATEVQSVASTPVDASPVADAGGGTPSGGAASGVEGSRIAAAPSPLSTLLPGLDVTDFIVVSTRRIGRTTMEYVLRLKISNSSANKYENVVATLEAAPAHIVIVDAIVTMGDIPPNSTVLSGDSFTINVDLATSTSFDDFVWRLEGDVLPPPPPPPPGDAPSQSGIFMNIDDLSIPGEATSDSHRDWIELQDVMDGIRRSGLATTAGSTRDRTRFVFDGLQAIKEVDRSTPKLRQAIAEGRIFTEVKIDIIRSCGGSFYTAFAITLSVARLESLALESKDLEQPPIEELDFDYTRIETMYTPVEADCSLGAPVFSTQDGDLLDL